MSRRRALLACAVLSLTAFGAPAPAAASVSEIKIAFVGDSMSDGVWAAIQRRASREACLKQRMKTGRFGEIGTGLARADKFHWPDKAKTLVADFGADLVIASFGLNDRTGVVDPAVNVRVEMGNPDWKARYTDQIIAFMRNASTGRAGLMWLGIPAMREAVANTDAIEKNELYRNAITGFGDAKVEFVEPWRLAASGDETFQSYWTDPSGSKVQIRAPDGVHFTTAGYDLIAAYLWPRLIAHLETTLGPESLRCES